MSDLAGKTVVFLGRLDAMPRRVAAPHVEACGGIVRRGLTRCTDVVVVGHGAYSLLEAGRLERKLAAADQCGATCVGENAILRTLGVLEPLASENRQISVEEVSLKSGLGLDVLRLLVLFDVIELCEGRCGFRDLLAAREVTRLLSEGINLAEILESISTVRRHGDRGESHHLARTKLVRLVEGQIAIRVGEAFADLDGQLRLSLSNPGNPSVDALFEAAERAADEGDVVDAEALYRRCVDLDKTDPTASFNLANVMREQGRRREAEFYFRLAVGIDPSFPEAWYNLADLVDLEGRRGEAKKYLHRAISEDPNYTDALYNLARLRYESREYAEAAEYWERYVALDPNSDWGHKARDGLTLCRQFMCEETLQAFHHP